MCLQQFFCVYICLDDDLDETLQNLELDHAHNTATVRPYAVPARMNQGDRPVNNSLDWQDNTLIPCEFCEIPVMADQLVLHQVKGWPGLCSHQTNHENSVLTKDFCRLGVDRIYLQIRDLLENEKVGRMVPRLNTSIDRGEGTPPFQERCKMVLFWFRANFARNYSTYIISFNIR